MFGLEKYIKDYGDGPKKIIKMGRSNLIIGIIALIFVSFHQYSLLLIK